VVAPLLTADPFDRLRVAPSLNPSKAAGPVDRRIRHRLPVIATESRRSVNTAGAAGWSSALTSINLQRFTASGPSIINARVSPSA